VSFLLLPLPEHISPPWDALNELVSKAGKQFDPEVVRAFKRVVSEKMEKG